MRPLASTAAVAFAVASLYLLYLTGPLVSPQHQLTFHLPGSAAVLFVPALLDLAVLTAALFGLLTCTQRYPRAELLLWAVLLVPLPSVLLQTAAGFAGRPAPHLLVSALLVASATLMAFTLARLSVLAPIFPRYRPTLTTLLGFVSLSGLVILGQLLWNGWQTRHLNPPFLAHVRKPGPVATASPRVVWVILDELSYRQIFSNRPPNLLLPNFDRLATDSTVFTATKAAAEYTRIAVPSLLTGIPLTDTDPTTDGQQLLLHPRGARHWQALDPADTVFADVQRAGLPTGVAGWYEPYCRLLPTVLNRCFWTYRDDLPAGLSADASIGTNTVAPLRSLGGLLQPLVYAVSGGKAPDREGQRDVARHAADYRDLYAAGDGMLHAQETGLLLLHMPIPHPWGFYDRRTGTFPAHRTSYLDNLVLADLYVGHLRSLMEADGSWNRTSLIVMGDHGWRTRVVWRPSGFWTAEEEAASHNGTLDDRPAMFLKLAGQQTPARLDSPFAASRTRALIDGLVTGKLRTSEDLQAWASQGNLTPPGEAR